VTLGMPFARGAGIAVEAANANGRSALGKEQRKQLSREDGGEGRVSTGGRDFMAELFRRFPAQGKAKSPRLGFWAERAAVATQR